MSLHDPAYAAFVKTLVELRMRSGLKQRQVAAALGWNQSVISKIETRQRRIDIVELIRVTAVLGTDPASLVRQIQLTIAATHTE
jgi:transcriptional regulator with XRE-family HTH domain